MFKRNVHVFLSANEWKYVIAIRLPSKSLPKQTVKLIYLHLGAKGKSFAAFARIATFLIFKVESDLGKSKRQKQRAVKKAINVWMMWQYRVPTLLIEWHIQAYNVHLVYKVKHQHTFFVREKFCLASLPPGASLIKLLFLVWAWGAK